MEWDDRKEVVRRGSYLDDLFDEPDWPAALAALEGRRRQDTLAAGLRLIEQALERREQVRARELAIGIAAALDARLEPLPDGERLFMTELRKSARTCRRQTFYSLEEVLRTLRHLVRCEAHMPRELHPQIT